MRLIDADDLDNIVLQLNKEGRTITRNEYKMLDSIIFEFPTIEAKPVHHGRWKRTNMKMLSFNCTECNAFAPYGVRTRYCPWCGALMEEQE